MKRIVLTFGLISGAILAAMTAMMIPMCMSGVVDLDRSEIVGYTSMVLAFLLVFFGIRSYRENVGGGAITFGKAFTVGILITLIASAVYVISWEIVYFNFVPDFADKYAAHRIEKMRASGATAAAIESMRQEMARFKVLYANPFLNTAITLLEVFPVGLIVTLVSAAILRRKARPSAPSTRAAIV
ncbi:MAG TPA: DUF4199 domain-containing protein [Thermoanaerobaculia bacterium]